MKDKIKVPKVPTYGVLQAAASVCWIVAALGGLVAVVTGIGLYGPSRAERIAALTAIGGGVLSALFLGAIGSLMFLAIDCADYLRRIADKP